MSQVSGDYEKSARQNTEEQIKKVVPRELLPSSGYAPIPGIYDIGWKEWMDLSYADWVKDMRKTDDEIINENRQWVLRLAPLIANGEFSLEQLKEWELQSYLTTDAFPIRIASHAFQNLNNKEVRDIILRHVSEEVGHAELKADFLVNAFGMDREKEVWNGKPLVAGRADMSVEDTTMEALRKENPILSYATIPFMERILPSLNQLMGRALREHYGFKDDILGFYDLHTYVDIYHERLGLYLMAKYATTKLGQELFQKAIEAIRRNIINVNREGYTILHKLK